ncbi:MAG TPA: hypothetical protein DCX75_01785, partial [Brevundimonas sp.]|nr:hypothetical protein [Brevundimonas sp.]
MTGVQVCGFQRQATRQQPVLHQVDLGFLAEGDAAADGPNGGRTGPGLQQFDHLHGLTVVDDHVLHEAHVFVGVGGAAEVDGLGSCDLAR